MHACNPSPSGRSLKHSESIFNWWMEERNYWLWPSLVTEICHPSELPPIKRRVGIEKKERIGFIPQKRVILRFNSLAISSGIVSTPRLRYWHRNRVCGPATRPAKSHSKLEEEYDITKATLKATRNCLLHFARENIEEPSLRPFAWSSLLPFPGLMHAPSSRVRERRALWGEEDGAIENTF
jgi:hypothetical protein